MDKERGGRTEADASPRANDEIALQRGPGVHVVADADPAVAGRNLADQLGADLAETADTAELALRARLRRPRTLTAAGATDEDDSRELLEADAATLAATSSRTLASAHEARLRLLAAAVERAERTCERTEEATGEHLDPAVSNGFAVHRDALRHASAAVVEAQRAIAELEARNPPADEPDAVGSRAMVHRPIESLQVRPLPAVEPMAIGALLIGVALAGAILLTSVPPVVALGPVLLGLFAAALIRRGTTTGVMAPARDARPSDPPPRPNGSAGTVYIDAPTARTVSPAGDQSELRQVDQVGADLDAAHAWLEKAQHNWTSLAGAADPLEIRTIDAESDPRRGRVQGVASETAAVRAATRVRDQARARWEAAWAEIGEPPPADAISGRSLDEAMDRLHERISDENSQLSRDRLNDLLSGRPLEAVVARVPGPTPDLAPPLVLVEPFDGLGAGRRATMKAQLEALAGHHEVIVIVRSGSDDSATADP